MLNHHNSNVKLGQANDRLGLVRSAFLFQFFYLAVSKDKETLSIEMNRGQQKGLSRLLTFVGRGKERKSTYLLNIVNTVNNKQVTMAFFPVYQWLQRGRVIS